MQSRMSKKRDSWGRGRKHSYWEGSWAELRSPIPRDTDPEREKDWPKAMQRGSQCQGVYPRAGDPSPHPWSPGQAGLQSPSPCTCRHPRVGSHGWPGGAQPSPQRRRRLRRPEEVRVRWGGGYAGARLGPELGRVWEGPCRRARQGWLPHRAGSFVWATPAPRLQAYWEWLPLRDPSTGTF